MKSIFRHEWFLGAGVVTFVFLRFEGIPLQVLKNPLGLGAVLVWLFAVILRCVISVVRHADHIAMRLGEPIGTLVLTLSVTAVEAASISAVMLHGENNPTLARDTLFAVIMIILNGMVGISLLIGGWRHREQQYNLQGANTYLSVIIPLAVLSLVLPNFTQTTAGPTLSAMQEVFLIVMSVGLYGAFLAIQSGRHRGFFTLGEQDVADHGEGRGPSLSLPLHLVLLSAYVVLVVFLAEELALPIDFLIETMHAPAELGGMLIAALVATPEAISATQAAFANHLQRSVNILLGSILATIGLTIPVMLVIGRFTGRQIVLGVEHGNLVLLLLTLFLSAITFTSVRTNVLQGLVHTLLFLSFLLLIFQS